MVTPFFVAGMRKEMKLTAFEVIQLLRCCNFDAFSFLSCLLGATAALYGDASHDPLLCDDRKEPRLRRSC